MVMNKGAQFFLLAAVIISSVVISLGIVGNTAIVNKEPERFYDFSYEVEREMTEVLNYEIYTGVTGDGELDEFVGFLVDDIRDNDPDADFMFIYGSNLGMDLKNYGSSSALVEGEELEGAGEYVVSEICYGSMGCQNVTQLTDLFNDSFGEMHLDESEMQDSDNITVKVYEHNFVFPISEHPQVIFIMRKDDGGDRFVTTN